MKTKTHRSTTTKKAIRKKPRQPHPMDDEQLDTTWIEVKEEPPEKLALGLAPSTGDSTHHIDIKPLIIVDVVKEESLDDFTPELPPSTSEQSRTSNTRISKRQNKTKNTNDGTTFSSKFNDGPVMHSLRARKCNKCVACNAEFSSNSLLDEHRSKCHGNMFDCDRCPYQTNNKYSLAVHQKTHRKNYCCSTCRKKFTFEMGLLVHQRHLRHGIYATAPDETFSCDKCDETFIYKSELLQHLSITKIYKCVACEVEFPCKLLRDRHRSEFHPKPKRFQYKCDACEVEFPSKLLQVRHQSEFHPKPIKCETCEKKFAGRSGLKDHQTKQEPGVFDCNECGKSCLSHACLRSHQRIAHSETEVKCKLCSKVFKSKDVLRVHLSRHAKVESECPVCHKMVSKASIHGHLAYHSKRFKCDLCKYAAANKCRVKKHIVGIHLLKKLEDDRRAATKSDQKLKCAKCSYQTDKMKNLKVHEGSHNKTFVCETCAKTFSISSHLKYHQMQHKHGAFATAHGECFNCDECDKTFSSPRHIRDHRRLVHAGKEGICEVCGKACKNQKSLRNHRQTHNRVECPVCNKMIPPRSQKRHMRLHSDSADSHFKCNLCEYSTVNKSNLERHIRQMHKSTPIVLKFKCDSCSKSFAARCHLNEHKKICYNGKLSAPAREISIPPSYEDEDEISSEAALQEPDSSAWQEEEQDEELQEEEQEDPWQKQEQGEAFQEQGHDEILQQQDSSAWQEQEQDKELQDPFQEQEQEQEEASQPQELEDPFREQVQEEVLQRPEIFQNIRKNKKAARSSKQARSVVSELKLNAAAAPKSKLFVCQFCSKIFTTNQNLQRHIAAFHLKIRNFLCDLCPKKFQNKACVSRHIESVHQDALTKLLRNAAAAPKSKSFVCQFCAKISTTYQNLQRHIEGVHQKTRKFSCNLCPKKFQNKACVSRHIESVHHDAATKLELNAAAAPKSKKTFVCQFCSKIFATKQNMQRHIEGVHHENLRELRIMSKLQM